MRTRQVALVSCASKKRTKRSKARDLYISDLFEKSLRFAEQLRPDYIGILSAKHGLLDLDTEIEPYDMTLVKMSSRQRQEWANGVLRQLQSRFDLDRDRFIFLAGQRYREYLTPYVKHYVIPLEGLPIGKQLQALKGALNEQ